MYLSHSDGLARVMLYANIYGTHATNALPGSGAGHYAPTYAGDTLILRNNQYTGAFRSPWLRVDQHSGKPAGLTASSPAPDYDSDSYRTYRSTNVKWDSARDWSRYGSLAGGIFAFDHERMFFLREQEVVHCRWRGDVTDSVSASYYNKVGATGSYGLVATMPKYTASAGTPYRSIKGVDLNDDGFPVYSWGPTLGGETVRQFEFDFFEYIKELESRIAMWGYLETSPSAQYKYRWSDLTVELTDYEPGALTWSRTAKITYQFQTRYHNGSEKVNTTYRVHYNLLFSWRAVPSISLFGTQVNWPGATVQLITDGSSVVQIGGQRLVNDVPRPDIITANVSNPNVARLWQGSDGNFVGMFSPIVQSGNHANDKLSQFVAQHKSTTFGSPPSRRIDLINHLDRVMDANLPDFRAASFLSASDALHSQLDVLQANNIENLSQLAELLRLLPDLPGLVRIVARAIKGDPRVIGELLDYISDLILKIKFGWKPTQGDLSELAATNLSQRLKEVSTPRWATGYGSFYYPFTDDLSFGMLCPTHSLFSDGKLELMVRSKVRLRIDLTTSLAGVYALNGAGLLPTLERVWNTVPFSFIVDWLTNASQRIASVDDALLWTTVKLDYAVHSYSLIYTPTDDELAHFGLTSPYPMESKSRLRLVSYRRESSRWMPAPRGTRFDFHRVSSRPDPLVVGALVWQRK